MDEEFKKLRKRGLWILGINLALALLTYIYYYARFDWVSWLSGGYVIVSIYLLVRRIVKKEPAKTETDNYIFGKKLGNKMSKTPQKFILEASMMSIVFLIIADVLGAVLTIFFTNLSLYYKITAGIGGFFGAIFMLALLLTTFQSYKSLIEITKVQKMITDAVAEGKEIDVNMDMKGGSQ